MTNERNSSAVVLPSNSEPSPWFPRQRINSDEYVRDLLKKIFEKVAVPDYTEGKPGQKQTVNVDVDWEDKKGYYVPPIFVHVNMHERGNDSWRVAGFYISQIPGFCGGCVIHNSVTKQDIAFAEAVAKELGYGAVMHTNTIRSVQNAMSLSHGYTRGLEFNNPRSERDVFIDLKAL